MKPILTAQDWQLLSAYLDDQLSPREQSQVEQRLRTRPEFEQALQDLRRNRVMLRSLPRRRVPHNFTLTPEMVASTRRSRFQMPQIMPVLRFSSALATLLVIVSLVADLLPGLSPVSKTSQAPESATAPAAEITTLNAPEAGDATRNAAGATGPDIVYWGGPPDVPYATGMGGAADGLGGGGGGGEGVYSSQLPNVFHQPNEQPPSIKSAPQAPPPADPQPQPTQSGMGIASAAPVTGNGPILGAQPNQGGELLNETPVDTSLPESSQEQPDTVARWRIVQIGLGLLAVVTGLAAYFLRRNAAR